VSPYGLSSLVVGLTQPQTGLLPKARALSAPYLKYLLLAVALAVAVGVVILVRRRRPAPAAAPPAATFVNTAAEPPGADVGLEAGDDAGRTDAPHRAT
jgi:hypothetical protein